MTSPKAALPLVKSLVQRLPFPVGALLARIPYRVRPWSGATYRQSERARDWWRAAAGEERRSWVLARTRAIVEHAWREVPFYRRLYERQGFQPDQLRTFEDLGRIPVVTKAMLRACPLEERSAARAGRYLANTGGSSGEPLAFFILPEAIGTEWAHMHRIWAKVGYRITDLKLTFGGRNLDEAAVAYDALRHHYAGNVYRPHAEICEALDQILARRTIRYLHGYPSAIYDFAAYCEAARPDLAARLRRDLRGVLLGSEYPVRRYREVIERVFGAPTVSWYGHTERAVLAWEEGEPFRYVPFQTYGHAEAVRDPDTGATRLVATGYGSLASPFIRYDTGDEIEVLDVRGGLLESFGVTTGREGDFVLDATGKKIPLTGLIFGRHHALFDHARFLQVQQPAPGRLTVLVTRHDGPGTPPLPEPLAPLFDSAGVALEVGFKVLSAPYLTRSGKVPLQVPPDARIE